MWYHILLRHGFLVKSKKKCFAKVWSYLSDISKFLMVVLRYQLFVIFNFEYAQIIKQTTTNPFTNNNNIKINLRRWNNRQVSASSWLQKLITWFHSGEIKHSFSLEVIIKGINRSWQNSGTKLYTCFIVSIFLFYRGYLSWELMIHRAAGGERCYLFNSTSTRFTDT